MESIPIVYADGAPDSLDEAVFRIFRKMAAVDAEIEKIMALPVGDDVKLDMLRHDQKAVGRYKELLSEVFLVMDVSMEIMGYADEIDRRILDRAWEIKERGMYGCDAEDDA